MKCPDCDGEGVTDDRGWPLRGQPFLYSLRCESCLGTGESKTEPSEEHVEEQTA